MKRMLMIALALLTLAAIVMAQDLPSGAVFFGTGFQAKTAGSLQPNQVHGWMAQCKRNPDIPIGGFALTNYACLIENYSADGTTSVEPDIDLVLLHKGWFTSGVQAAGGLAWNQQGVGGAFSGGFWATASIAKLIGIPNALAVGSLTWSKANVMTALQQPKLPMMLQDIGAFAQVRAGVGKSW